VLKYIFPLVMDIPSLKNPFAKRKRGNMLITSLAKNLGETGFDREPTILKLTMGICHDNNYKIRMDGVTFLKDYLSKESTLKSSRLTSVYIPELMELLNDEEAYIRIEAIEIVTQLI
jgi:hypothetical protein